ncbi:MAG: hypothetical protein KAH77_08925, partial [Thiomargarita sp.]|nr:hypothetical protein [Thiomargarita sp.]
MQKINLQKTQISLQKFDFSTLFIDNLGWNHPTTTRDFHHAHPIAELSMLTVFEIVSKEIPERAERTHIYQKLSEYCPENILIFT